MRSWPGSPRIGTRRHSPPCFIGTARSCSAPPGECWATFKMRKTWPRRRSLSSPEKPAHSVRTGRSAGGCTGWRSGSRSELGRTGRSDRLWNAAPSPWVPGRTPTTSPAATCGGRAGRRTGSAGPEKIRTPLVLCYLDGQTQDEAARQLGWNPRTVKARLAAGREVLHRRLIHRGLSLSAALTGPLLTANAVLPDWLKSLPAAAGRFAAHRPLDGSVTSTVINLSQQGVRDMRVLLLTSLTAAMALTLAGLGFGAAFRPSGSTPQAVPVQPGQPAAANDTEPLPPGAVARIGTTRFRQSSWHKRVFFTADGKTLIHTEDGRTIHYWDVATGRKIDQVEIPGAMFQHAEYDAKRNLLAIVGTYWPDEKDRTKSEHAAWLFDTSKRHVVQFFRMPDLQHGVYFNVKQSTDGTKLFTFIEGNLRVWEVKTGAELARAKDTRPGGGSGGHAGRQDDRLRPIRPPRLELGFGRNSKAVHAGRRGRGGTGRLRPGREVALRRRPQRWPIYDLGCDLRQTGRVVERPEFSLFVLVQSGRHHNGRRIPLPDIITGIAGE